MLRIWINIVLLLVCYPLFSTKQNLQEEPYWSYITQDLGRMQTEKHESMVQPPTETCASFTIHNDGYDILVEYWMNKETNNWGCGETIVYPQEGIGNSSATHSMHSQSMQAESYDHFQDFTREQRLQEIADRATITAYNDQQEKVNPTTVSTQKNYLARSDLILKHAHTLADVHKALNHSTIRVRLRIQKNALESILQRKSNKYVKKQIKVIDNLLSKNVPNLLHKIQHGRLKKAKSSFKKLAKIWCWKHKDTHLVPELKSKDEQEFITTVGFDIMKIAESNLITSPDYIAKHVKQSDRTIINNCKEKCIQLQRKGDWNSLFQERDRLRSIAIKNGKKVDIVNNISLAIVEHALQNPLAVVFNNISYAPTLEMARQELINLESMILDQAKQKNITLMSELKSWSISCYGFDVLEVGRGLYMARPDFVKTPENESLLSDGFKPIVYTVKTKSLPIAHLELVNVDRQIQQAYDVFNIKPTEQKEFLIKQFGYDAPEYLHTVYKDRQDYKNLITFFVPIDVQNSTLKILETNNSYASAAYAFDDISQQVLDNAKLCNFENISTIEDSIEQSLQVMREPQNSIEFAYHATIVDHILTDLQHKTSDIVAGKETFLDRAPILFARGLKQFISNLNPITQAQQIIEISSDATHIIGQVIQHPIATTETLLDITGKAYEFLVDTARLTSDITIGKYYLSEQEYQQRLDDFDQAIQNTPLTQLTAEQWVDITAKITADIVVLKGISGVASFLKEIDVIGKISNEAKLVAQGLKNAIEEHPAYATAEGIVLKMSNQLEDVSGTAKTIYNSIVDTKIFSDLKLIGENIWQSPAGIIYGDDKKFGNTFNHMLAHMTPNPTKKVHTVFNVPKSKIVELIDEAWILKQNPLATDPRAYIVDMKKIIGTQGETAIRIVVKKSGTCELLTAYPVTI